jgi:hypothetical protein
MLFLVRPRTVLRAMPLLAAAAMCAGCLVDNPAYDPSERNTAVDAAVDARAVSDLAVTTDLPVVIDSPVVAPDTRVNLDAAVPDAVPDVASDSLVISAAMPRCDAKDPSLSLCLTFDGNITDYSANAMSLVGVASYVASTDGSAYQVSPGVGLRSANSAAFVSTEITVDLWVKMTAFPETQVQALVVVPGVISVSVTGQGQIICDVGGIRAAGPSNTLTPNTWTGISCTYDGIAINIYANGQFATGRQISMIVPAVAKAPINIGSANGFSPFSGHIDNLRFWRKRLTPSELCKSSPECLQ